MVGSYATSPSDPPVGVLLVAVKIAFLSTDDVHADSSNLASIGGASLMQFWSWCDSFECCCCLVCATAVFCWSGPFEWLFSWFVCFPPQCWRVLGAKVVLPVL